MQPKGTASAFDVPLEPILSRIYSAHGVMPARRQLSQWADVLACQAIQVDNTPANATKKAPAVYATPQSP